ncbi:MAG TPA: cytochrome c oxidase subunit II transmembrane domain-containing protein, partial [Tepidisphaeraceae bacterium]|nr:cytochrome c oxidase subunit II transmembrane domain-containing protein [Tepidisphaeraceae bacterium]
MPLNFHLVSRLDGLATLAASWWLPPDHSLIGHQVDRLFDTIFAICGAITLLVFVLMVLFLIRYRHRNTPRRAHYSHGS